MKSSKNFIKKYRTMAEKKIEFYSKIRVIRRRNSTSYYVTIPKEVAEALKLSQYEGKVVKVILELKDEQ